MHATLPLVLLYLTSGPCVSAQLTYHTANTNPTRFTDKVLARSERVTEGREFVPHLGYVRILNTLLSARGAHEMPTKFSIINLHKHTPFLSFQPGIASVSDVQGTYEYNLDKMIESGFNVGTRTIIMVPGYRSHKEDEWIREARTQWLKLDPEADVIQVSWSESNRDVYARSVAHTPLIARQITIFIHYLATLSGTSLANDDFVSKIHMIGHSLGAHIAGFVGQDLGGRLGRITALDPAGPSFDQYEPENRLDPSDAKLVEAIYTNRGKMKYFNLAMSASLEAFGSLPLIRDVSKALGSSYSGEANTAWYGIDKNLGHINYYANNGRVQPGCSGLIHICDHNRAHGIYTGLLKYEVDLRAQLRRHLGSIDEQTWRELLKLSRFETYKAEDYDGFTTGKHLASQCKEILDSPLDAAKAASEFERQRAFNACSLPLDLVTPVDELKEEFSTYRGIDFSPDTPGTDIYYFKTLENESYVGEHYMVKILTESKLSDWNDEECSLSAEAKVLTEDGYKIVSLEATKLQYSIENDLPIAMPFIHAGWPSSRLQLMRLLDLLDEDYQRASSEIILQNLHLFPKKISLSVAKPKAPSLMGSLKDATLKMIKYSSSDSKCQLAIRKIELQRIGLPRHGAKTFVGLYNAEPKDEVKILKRSEFRKLYEEATSQSPRELVGCLSLSGLFSFPVRLSGVVVGDGD